MNFSNKFSIVKKKLIPTVIIALFFLAYLLLGYSVYKDYGISTDESTDFIRGKSAYNYMVTGDKLTFDKTCLSSIFPACQYPSFFSIIAYRFAMNGTSQSIYYHRHQLTFAYFAFSVFIFFLVAWKIFKNWKIGLLGALFLIISPRIFAHSFYNPKDIPFLSAYVIALFTLLLFLEKKNIFTAILHGLALGIACAIRTPGIILLPVTAFFYLFDLLLAKEKVKAYLRALFFLLASGSVAAVMVYIFSPSLYGNPIGGYIQVFNLMKQYPWINYNLYLGHNITNQIPWHYSLVWFAISSPIFYVVLFLAGLIILAVKTVRARHIEQFQAMRNLYVVSSLGILPILAVIVEKSVIYDDNRQMYFVYPALLLISIYGFVNLMDKLHGFTRYWQLGLVLILAAGLASPVYFMLRYHPYEELYFNFLAGPSMTAIKENFPVYAWSVTDKEALEYILETDHSPIIRIKIYDNLVESARFLPAKQYKRLDFFINNNRKETGTYYILTNYRYYPEQKNTLGKVYYSVKIGDADIFTVYRVDNK